MGLIQVARARKSSGDARLQVDNVKLVKGLFARHAVAWAQLSLANQLEWGRRARRVAATKNATLAEEVKSMHAELDLISDQLAECDTNENPLTMSAAAFSEADLGLFTRLFYDPAFRNKTRIAGLRDAAMKCPLPLTGEPLRELERIDVYKKEEPRMPHWAQIMATHRDITQDGLIGHTAMDGSVSEWLLLYMVQSHPQLCRGGQCDTDRG